MPLFLQGVITDDVVGRPTEIRFFYKEQESDNYVVYFPNFNLTARDPGGWCGDNTLDFFFERVEICFPPCCIPLIFDIDKAALYKETVSKLGGVPHNMLRPFDPSTCKQRLVVT